jgi:hypothetical protein
VPQLGGKTVGIANEAKATDLLPFQEMLWQKPTQMGLIAQSHRGIATVTALVAVGFSFDGELEHVHVNLVRNGSVHRQEDWRWSNGNLFTGQMATVAGSATPADDVQLP